MNENKQIHKELTGSLINQPSTRVSVMNSQPKQYQTLDSAITNYAFDASRFFRTIDNPDIDPSLREAIGSLYKNLHVLDQGITYPTYVTKGSKPLVSPFDKATPSEREQAYASLEAGLQQCIRVDTNVGSPEVLAVIKEAKNVLETYQDRKYPATAAKKPFIPGVSDRLEISNLDKRLSNLVLTQCYINQLTHYRGK